MTQDEPDDEEGVAFSSRLFWLLIVGVALVFIGIIVLAVASVASDGGSASTGVIVFIGPFPIAFGSGPNAALLIIIGIILAVVSVALFLAMNRRRSWV
jgi:uncharacterized membrane protein